MTIEPTEDLTEDDWAFEVEEDEIPVPAARPRTLPSYPTQPEDGRTWGEVFAGWKAAHGARKLKAVAEPARLLDVEKNVDPLSLFASPKKFAERALQMGWTVEVRTSRILHPDKFQMADGKPRKDGSQIFAGELVTPEHIKNAVGLRAWSAQWKVGFMATWLDRKFVSAHCICPVGFQAELYADYWKDGKDISGKAVRDGEKTLRIQRDREYNDGTQHIFGDRNMTAAGEFEAWLYDWMEMLIPDYARPVPKPRAVKPTAEDQFDSTNMAMLAGADWSAE